MVCLATAVAVACGGSASRPPVAELPPPPATEIREVTDSYFDTALVDRYRWLEDVTSPETVAWMKAQSDYSRAALDSLPLRAGILERLAALSNAVAPVAAVQRVGDKYFFLRVAPGENDAKLYMKSAGGAARLIYNPMADAADGKRYAIDYFAAARDAMHVAVGVSEGGSEQSELRIVETETGRVLDERIDRANFGSPSWLPDNRSFFYTRLQNVRPGAPATEKYLNSRSYLHRLGTDPEGDRPLFGPAVVPGIDVHPAHFSVLVTSPGWSHVLAVVLTGVEPNVRIFVAPLASLDGARTAWHKVADYADGISNAELQGDDLFLLTYKDSPHFKVLRTSAVTPDISRAAVIVPDSRAIIKDLFAADDALYVQQTDGGLARILRVPYGDTARPVNLPFEGAIASIVVDRRQPGVVFRLESWTQSPAYYAYDPVSDSADDTGLLERSPVDFSGIESHEVMVRGHDGTMIPLSIVHRKGLRLNGRNPTLLSGYGAYGLATDPAFDPGLLAWLERGGVRAVAHVRGGGELGREWHLAGQKLTKMNTVRDFISCAEYLIAGAYTSAAYLAGSGGSAGGITIGRAITERPDLFAAAVPQVGVLNPVRMETTANGVPNIPEFGSVVTENGFRGLLAMDSYHHVKDGAAYPALLITHGVNDPRVDVWMSSKFAARMQAASSSARPVLLRIDYDAGHGFGTTRDQRNAERADIYAFLLEYLGR